MSRTKKKPRGFADKCWGCGEKYRVEVFEFWDDRNFMLDSCCEWGMWDFVDNAERVDWRELFLDVWPFKIRQVYDNFESLKIDYGLRECGVTLAQAKRFITKWHRHHKPPCGWRWGHALQNGERVVGGVLIGVAMVGRPVARAINHNEVVEVNRLCIRTDQDQALVWNAASMLYTAAAHEAERRGFKKIITYTLESESGVSLAAAGWMPEARTKGGSWNTPARSRQDKGPTCRKIRWARELTK
jgi:hypothetical protein